MLTFHPESPRVLVVGTDPPAVERLIAACQAAGCNARAGLEARQWQRFRPQLTIVDERLVGAASALIEAIRRVMPPSHRIVPADLLDPAGVHALLAGERTGAANEDLAPRSAAG